MSVPSMERRDCRIAELEKQLAHAEVRAAFERECAAAAESRLRGAIRGDSRPSSIASSIDWSATAPGGKIRSLRSNHIGVVQQHGAVSSALATHHAERQGGEDAGITTHHNSRYGRKDAHTKRAQDAPHPPHESPEYRIVDNYAGYRQPTHEEIAGRPTQVPVSPTYREIQVHSFLQTTQASAVDPDPSLLVLHAEDSPQCTLAEPVSPLEYWVQPCQHLLHSAPGPAPKSNHQGADPPDKRVTDWAPATKYVKRYHSPCTNGAEHPQVPQHTPSELSSTVESYPLQLHAVENYLGARVAALCGPGRTTDGSHYATGRSHPRSFPPAAPACLEDKEPKATASHTPSTYQNLEARAAALCGQGRTMEGARQHTGRSLPRSVHAAQTFLKCEGEQVEASHNSSLFKKPGARAAALSLPGGIMDRASHHTGRSQARSLPGAQTLKCDEGKPRALHDSSFFENPGTRAATLPPPGEITDRATHHTGQSRARSLPGAQTLKCDEGKAKALHDSSFFENPGTCAATLSLSGEIMDRATHHTGQSHARSLLGTQTHSRSFPGAQTHLGSFPAALCVPDSTMDRAHHTTGRRHPRACPPAAPTCLKYEEGKVKALHTSSTSQHLEPMPSEDPKIQGSVYECECQCQSNDLTSKDTHAGCAICMTDTPRLKKVAACEAHLRHHVPSHDAWCEGTSPLEAPCELLPSYYKALASEMVRYKEALKQEKDANEMLRGSLESERGQWERTCNQLRFELEQQQLMQPMTESMRSTDFFANSRNFDNSPIQRHPTNGDSRANSFFLSEPNTGFHHTPPKRGGPRDSVMIGSPLAAYHMQAPAAYTDALPAYHATACAPTPNTDALPASHVRAPATNTDTLTASCTPASAPTANTGLLTASHISAPADVGVLGSSSTTACTPAARTDTLATFVPQGPSHTASADVVVLRSQAIGHAPLRQIQAGWTEQERFQLTHDRSQLTRDRSQLTRDRSQLTRDRSQLTRDRSQLTHNRSQLTHDRSQLTRLTHVSLLDPAQSQPLGPEFTRVEQQRSPLTNNSLLDPAQSQSLGLDIPMVEANNPQQKLAKVDFDGNSSKFGDADVLPLGLQGSRVEANDQQQAYVPSHRSCCSLGFGGSDDCKAVADTAQILAKVKFDDYSSKLCDADVLPLGLEGSLVEANNQQQASAPSQSSCSSLGFGGTDACKFMADTAQLCDADFLPTGYGRSTHEHGHGAQEVDSSHWCQVSSQPLVPGHRGSQKVDSSHWCQVSSQPLVPGLHGSQKADISQSLNSSLNSWFTPRVAPSKLHWFVLGAALHGINAYCFSEN